MLFVHQELMTSSLESAELLPQGFLTDWISASDREKKDAMIQFILMSTSEEVFLRSNKCDRKLASLFYRVTRVISLEKSFYGSSIFFRHNFCCCYGILYVMRRR